VFSIDADERVSPALAGELLSKVQDGRHAAYRVPIRSEILGRGFRFSGTQDDQPVRLFRRGSGGWVGAVHEVIEVAGTTGLLRHHLAHTTLENTRAFLNKIERYTTLEAWSLFKAGERFQAIDVCVRPFWVFSKLYIGKLGYRDGLEGFLFCVFSAVSVGIRAWKLREFERSARAREEKEWLAGRIEQARWVWNEGQSRRSA
jgi:hypothetical protein